MAVKPSTLELPSGDRDRALVEAHRTGDVDAFPAIVQDHYRSLLAQAERKLGSHAEAEDAVQEAFERAFAALDRFGSSGEYRLGPWLSRIVANVCARHGARRLAERDLREKVAGTRVPSVDTAEAASDPSVLVAVQAAIDALPASQRSTFLLHEIDGLSYPQVADHLSISEDNARARVHRAKATLRRSLDLARLGMLGVVPAAEALRRGVRRLRLAVHPSGGSKRAVVTSGHDSGGGSFAIQLSSNPAAQAVASVVPSGAIRGTLIAGLAAGIATVVPGGSATSPPTATATPAAVEVAAAAPGEAPAIVSTDPSPVTTAVAAAPGTASVTTIADDGFRWLETGDAVPVAGGTWECAWATTSPPDPGAGAISVGTATGARLQTSRTALTTVSSHPSFVTGAKVTGVSGPDTPVTVKGQACLPPESGALFLELSNGDQVVRLAGVLVATNVDGGRTGYVFRGNATAQGELPWGLGGHFMAMFEVVQPDNTVTLRLAFSGAPAKRDPGPSGGGSPTTTTPQPTTTTLPPAETVPHLGIGLPRPS